MKQPYLNISSSLLKLCTLKTKEIRNQLIENKGYTNEELPTNQTLNSIVNKLGYNMKRVQKVNPLKKIKETDAIFKKLHEIHKVLKEKQLFHLEY